MPKSTNSSGEILSVRGELSGDAVSGWSLPEERRSKFRYPLNLSVRFRSLSGSPFSGAGRTVNVSSRGVLVVLPERASQHEISVAASLEMRIDWPSLLDGKIPLQLLAVGRVIRRGESAFAAAFERYQFRTARNSSQRPARLRGEVIEWPPNKVKVLD